MHEQLDDLILHDLRRDFDEELIERFHAEVLVPSFDANELDSVEELTRGLRVAAGDPELLATVALARDGTLLGGVVGERYASLGVVLLAYLAVGPGLRGRGVGTRLMQVAERWCADGAVNFMLAEVHDPRSWAGLELHDPAARLRFYDRLGARLLGVPFTQPAIRPEAERVRGFLLLAMHVDARAEVPRPGGGCGVPAELVTRFVRHYFTLVEGVGPPYDAELERLLATIERQPVVPLLTVDELDLVALSPA